MNLMTFSTFLFIASQGLIFTSKFFTVPNKIPLRQAESVVFFSKLICVSSVQLRNCDTIRKREIKILYVNAENKRRIERGPYFWYQFIEGRSTVFIMVLRLEARAVSRHELTSPSRSGAQSCGKRRSLPRGKECPGAYLAAAANASSQNVAPRQKLQKDNNRVICRSEFALRCRALCSTIGRSVERQNCIKTLRLLFERQILFINPGSARIIGSCVLKCPSLLF